MTEQKKCPWYIWGFSFLAMFVLFTSIEFRLFASVVRRKFDWALWGEYCAEAVVDLLLLFMLPLCLAMVFIMCLFPAAWGWLGFPLAYLLGIYPARRFWAWRKKHL